jgi:hypothetical protein
MEFTLKIEAPELASAVNNLAAALNNFASAYSQPVSRPEKAAPVEVTLPAAPKKTAKAETAPAADAPMTPIAMRNACVDLVQEILQTPERMKALKGVMKGLGAPNVQSVTDEQLPAFYEALKGI